MRYGNFISTCTVYACPSTRHSAFRPISRPNTSGGATACAGECLFSTCSVYELPTSRHPVAGRPPYRPKSPKHQRGRKCVHSGLLITACTVYACPSTRRSAYRPISRPSDSGGAKACAAACLSARVLCTRAPSYRRPACRPMSRPSTSGGAKACAAARLSARILCMRAPLRGALLPPYKSP